MGGFAGVGIAASLSSVARGQDMGNLDDLMPAQLGIDYADAWSSHDPARVADFYAEDGQIVINNGEPIRGRAAIADMAAGFYAAFPDLKVYCDSFRRAGNHVLFSWTLEGHHAQTGRLVRVPGWEEWDLDEDGKVASSRGWFDAEEYQAQIDGRSAPY